MNASIIVSIILSFALTLTSCSKTQNKNETTDNSQQIENTQQENNEVSDNSKSENTETEEPEIELPPEPVLVNKFAGQTLEEFFDGAAFVGDSVMYGFELYCGRNKNPENSALFLTKTSFAARHALSDVTENSYHPLYNDTKMKVEDALVLEGSDKVFISLGLNDVRVTPKTYFENYITFIDRIKEKNPDIDIFIVSATYPIQTPNPNKMGADVALDYRNQLLDLNTRLQAYASDGNAYYVDVITPISSPEGFLADNYSSDSYVHLTNKAYTVWSEVISSYATTLIETGIAPNDTGKSGFILVEQDTSNTFTENEPETEEIVPEDIAVKTEPDPQIQNSDTNTEET